MPLDWMDSEERKRSRSERTPNHPHTPVMPPSIEQTEIQIKEHLGILIDTAFATVLTSVQDIHSVEVLELANDLCQLCKITSRADIDYTDIHLCIKESPAKGWNSNS